MTNMNPLTYLKQLSAQTVVFGLLLLTLVVGGCSCSEDYSCDDTACFVCDGLDCREIEPPSRRSCSNDSQCGADQRCTDEGCVDFACDSDDECERGTVCRANARGDVCLGPSEPDPTFTPGNCSGPADCGSGEQCMDGLCVDEGTPTDCGTEGCACESTCDTGFTCVSGSCRSEDNVCRFNVECGEGRVCVDGACAASCESMECPGGQVCSDGVCEVDPGTIMGCMETPDCDDGERCVANSCVPECAGDSECGEGLYCNSGACVIDDRPRAFCETDDECADGRECVDGVCRTPCDTADACLRVDVQLPFCIESYCVTSNEATSDCATNAECDADERCVDGICS